MPRRTSAVATIAMMGLSLALVSCGDKAPLGDVTINFGLGKEAPGFVSGEPPVGFDIALKDFVVQDVENRKTQSGEKITVGLSERLTAGQRETLLLNRRITLVIATFSITEDRNKAGIDFAGPYLKTSQAFLVRDRGLDTIDQRQDLAGKSMCRVGRTTGINVPMPESLQQTTIAESVGECVELLEQDKVDVVFSDTLILYGFQRRNPELKVALAGDYGAQQYYGIGILGGRQDQCQLLNRAIVGYLNTRWRADFEAYLGAVKADHPNFESDFKPTRNDMDALSCRLPNGPAA